jgi:hypothetical protein
VANLQIFVGMVKPKEIPEFSDENAGNLLTEPLAKLAYHRYGDPTFLVSVDVRTAPTVCLPT